MKSIISKYLLNIYNNGVKIMNKRKLGFLLLVLLIISLNLATGITQVKATTKIEEIKATGDARIMEDYPNTNYGADQAIKLWYSPKEEGYLFFDLYSLIEKNYTSVMLRIHIGMSTSTTIQVFPVIDLWDEDIIEWSNAPDVNMSIMCSQYIPVTTRIGYINVTSIVSNFTSGFTRYFGFYLKPVINGLDFYSKESPDEEKHPTLEITVPSQPAGPSQPSIAGFEVTIAIFGMLGVIFILVINKRKITKKNPR
jgi:hypothetical protein